MAEHDEKDKTVEFNPVKDEKPHVNRNEKDIYTAARTNVSYDEDYEEEVKEENTNNLIYIAAILAAVLVIIVIAGIIIISRMNSTKKEENEVIENNPPETVISQENESEKEEEEEEEVIINSYNIVFINDSVFKTDEGYTVLADLLDNNMNHIGNEKLILNDETDIREQGHQLSLKGFMYAVERIGEERLVFKGKIREEDKVLTEVSYDGNIMEDIEKEEIPPEEIPGEGIEVTEGELEPENPSSETEKEDIPVENPGLIEGI